MTRGQKVNGKVDCTRSLYIKADKRDGAGGVGGGRGGRGLKVGLIRYFRDEWSLVDCSNDCSDKRVRQLTAATTSNRHPTASSSWIIPHLLRRSIETSFFCYSSFNID